MPGEPKAADTGQNITFSRELLAGGDVEVESLLLDSKPYMERRSYATCRKLWPEVEVVRSFDGDGVGVADSG